VRIIDTISARTLAELFHSAYERLAPEYGYDTREHTRVFDPKTPNGQFSTTPRSSLARRSPIRLRGCRLCRAQSVAVRLPARHCGLGAAPRACCDLRGLRHGQDADAARMGAARPGRVLILAPLAVAGQTIREGEKFGIEARATRDRRRKSPGKITVANYEMLEHFDPAQFNGRSCWTSRASSRATTAPRAPRSSKPSGRRRSGSPAPRPRRRTITWSLATMPSSWA
jgi:hypothetical protein